MSRAMVVETQILERGPAERERVLRLLRAHEAAIRARGVTRLRLFGSIARGEARSGSDVDLLAEIDRRTRFSLIELVDLQHFLGDLLDRKVEVGTTLDQARPRIRERIETDAVLVF